MKKHHVIDVQQENLRAELLPRLLRKVFHVTDATGFKLICETGAIKPNRDGLLPHTYPQSQNSYFSRRGCVCMCDLRSVTEEELEVGLSHFYFLNPHDSNIQVILFLRSQAHGHLIPWTRKKEEKADREMVASYIESGFPGDIDISQIDEVIEVHIQETPLDPNDNTWSGMVKRVHRAERKAKLEGQP